MEKYDDHPVHIVTIDQVLDCEGDCVNATENSVKFIPDDEDVAERKSNVIEYEKQLNQVDRTNETNAGDLEQNLCYKDDDEFLKTSGMNNPRCESTHMENNVLEHTECVANEVIEKECGTKPKQCISVKSLHLEEHKTENLSRQIIASSRFNCPENLFPSPPIKKYIPLEGKENVVDYKEGRPVTLEECFNNYCSYLDEFSQKYLK